MADSFPRFTTQLIKFSENETYESIIRAKEWEYKYTVEIYENRQGKCICGQPIKYLFFIKNKLNGNELLLGSTCIDYISKEYKKEMNDIKKTIKKFKCLNAEDDTEDNMNDQPDDNNITGEDIEIINKYNIDTKLNGYQFEGLSASTKRLKIESIQLLIHKNIFKKDIPQHQIDSKLLEFDKQQKVETEALQREIEKIQKEKIQYEKDMKMCYNSMLKQKKSIYFDIVNALSNEISVSTLGNYHGSELITETEYNKIYDKLIISEILDDLSSYKYIIEKSIVITSSHKRMKSEKKTMKYDDKNFYPHPNDLGKYVGSFNINVKSYGFYCDVYDRYLSRNNISELSPKQKQWLDGTMKFLV